MLKTALRSIANQSALSQISEIIVVENGADRQSEAVCNEFQVLPINYVFNNIPIAPGRNLAREWLRHIKEDHFAILFDDDWWIENHLERGIHSFSFANDVVASYGACALLEGEEHYLKYFFGQFNMWFATDEKPAEDRWKFRLQQMLVANLISTTCHFSSIIVNREAWAECIEELGDNPFDTDRIIATMLSTKGSVILDRIPSVLIRVHGQQEGVIMNNEVGRFWWDQTSRKLTDIASSSNIDLASTYRSLLLKKGVSVGELRKFENFQSIDYLVDQGIVPRPETIPVQETGEETGHQDALKKMKSRLGRLLRRLDKK
jgi:glycosyltransferase involved in cell wall biosynthesis